MNQTIKKHLTTNKTHDTLIILNLTNGDTKMENLIEILKAKAAQIPTLYKEPSIHNTVYFAVRGHHTTDVKIGDTLAASYDHTIDEGEYVEFRGTCACTAIRYNELDMLDDDEIEEQLQNAINNARNYHDHNLLLVVGLDTEEWTNDNLAHEVILEDCTVLAIIER